MRVNSSISNFKYIMRFLLFLLLLGGIFWYAGQQYQKAADKNVINAFTQRRFDDFYALPPNSLDMVFIGSSHSYCTFDPENFDNTLGVSSFQMGTPLQHPDTTYYSLKEIYNTQTPKVVVMELYWGVLGDEFEMKQANSFFEVLKNQDLKKEYIQKVFPLGEQVKYALLPIRFQQDYFAYEANEMENEIEEKYQVEKKRGETQKGQEYYESKGYVFCDMQMLSGEYDETNQFKGLKGDKWRPAKTQLEYVEKIAALCREKGSELLLVTAPVANVSMEYIEDYESIHRSVAEIAKRLQTPYIDYNMVNKELDFLKNEHFRDDAHLNDSGVKLVDSHFLNWLVENTESFREN